MKPDMPNNPALPSAGANRPNAAALGVPEELRARVDTMIVDGDSFEQIAGRITAEGPHALTVADVENYYRQNLELQKTRIRREVETADAILGSVKNPRSTRAKLAQAVLMTGLAQINRSQPMTQKDAIRAHLEEQVVHLRRQCFNLECKRAQQRNQYEWAHLRLEVARWKLARKKLLQLESRMRKNPEDFRILPPDAYRRIQEIYGVVHEPLVPKAPDEKKTQS